MTRPLGTAARYARMRWNTPLAPDHAAQLLDALDVGDGDTVLELGCGWGALLLQALAVAQSRGQQVHGIGVDTDDSHIARAHRAAESSGLTDVVTLQQASVTQWSQPASRVICVGTSHAWGGTREALRALVPLTDSPGRLLYGDGCWERPPTPEATALFPEVLPLHEIVRAALEEGWRIRHLSTAALQEWDEFETTWRAGAEEWLSAHPDDAQSVAVREELDSRLREYVAVYRGVLGFCYLVLTR